MRNIEDQTDEILFDLSAENRYNRVRELLSKENQLIQANATLYAWEIFRNGISEQYPELLKWCPQSAITIHDPELPGVVIIDQVNP